MRRQKEKALENLERMQKQGQTASTSNRAPPSYSNPTYGRGSRGNNRGNHGYASQNPPNQYDNRYDNRYDNHYDGGYPAQRADHRNQFERGNKRGNGRGRGNNRMPQGQGYSDHEEKSADEDLEQLHYQQLQEKGKKQQRYGDINDYFDPNYRRSRSPKGTFEPILTAEELAPAKQPERQGEISEVKSDNQSEGSLDSEELFNKTLEENKQRQMKALEENAAFHTLNKKPKKGKKIENVQRQSAQLGDYMKGNKDQDEKVDIDLRTRITGIIVQDFKREFKRDRENRFDDQASHSNKANSERRGKLRINRPKFIGLNAKFEYRSMIQAGKKMFKDSEVFKPSTSKDLSKLELNEEGLQRVSGFGRVDEQIAQQVMAQMLQNFQLYCMYGGHYSNFKDSKRFSPRHAEHPDLHGWQQDGRWRQLRVRRKLRWRPRSDEYSRNPEN